MPCKGLFRIKGPDAKPGLFETTQTSPSTLGMHALVGHHRRSRIRIAFFGSIKDNMLFSAGLLRSRRDSADRESIVDLVSCLVVWSLWSVRVHPECRVYKNLDAFHSHSPPIL